MYRDPMKTRGSEPTQLDIEAIYVANWHRLARMAVLLVDDAAVAEDVVQEAFIGLHRRASSLRTSEAALRYETTSIVNRSRSVLRHRRTVRIHQRSVRVGSAPAADHDIILADERAELVRALGSLAPRQREVLVLRYWSGLSESEIAHTLGISVGTVKSSASRGLDTLE
jgi:RNA polymerase sigma-70 factor (sigma-E family)